MTPVRASFRDIAQEFDSEKEAYVWLIEKFRDAKGDLLETEANKPYIATGKGRRHFARSPQELYEKTPDQAENPNRYVPLRGRWFANVHLNVEEKLSILDNLSSAIGLKRERDWQWDDGKKRPGPLDLSPLD